MDHKSELAKLPPWCRRIVEALLEQPPHMVSAELAVSRNRITWARRVAWNVLGDESALMNAATNHRPGPVIGSKRRGPGEDDWVRVLTTPGPDGHVHVARFNGAGNGLTSEVGGHVHRVMELDVVATDHGHELTDRRA